jgi:hypothetical protein
MTQHKQTESNIGTNIQTKIETPQKSSFDWLGILFKLSALFLFSIYLYGYGAAVGYAEKFGIPQSALYSSSTDLLGIASETLLHHTLNFLKPGGVFFYLWAILKNSFDFMLLLGLVFSFAWFIGISLAKRIKKIPKVLIKTKNFLFPDVKVYFIESSFATAIRSIWHGILFIIIALAAQSIVIIAFYASFIFILIAPILGYFAAANHAELDIIRPVKCDVIQTRVQFIEALDKQKTAKLAGIKDEPAKPTANCVKVTLSDTKVSKTIAGRSVLAGSDYILVYEMSGKTTRIPIKTAVIEAADDAVLIEVALQNEKLFTAKVQ